MVNLIERKAETVAPNAVGEAYATCYHHINANRIGKMEQAFNAPTVETFERTSVVSRLAHGQHERLHSQSATLMHNNAHVGFGYLTRYRTEKAYQLHQRLAEKA